MRGEKRAGGGGLDIGQADPIGECGCVVGGVGGWGATGVRSKYALGGWKRGAGIESSYNLRVDLLLTAFPLFSSSRPRLLLTFGNSRCDLRIALLLTAFPLSCSPFPPVLLSGVPGHLL